MSGWLRSQPHEHVVVVEDLMYQGSMLGNKYNLLMTQVFCLTVESELMSELHISPLHSVR